MSTCCILEHTSPSPTPGQLPIHLGPTKKLELPVLEFIVFSPTIRSLKTRIDRSYLLNGVGYSAPIFFFFMNCKSGDVLHVFGSPSPCTQLLHDLMYRVRALVRKVDRFVSPHVSSPTAPDNQSIHDAVGKPLILPLLSYFASAIQSISFLFFRSEKKP